MKRKLTITIDEALIPQVKRRAEQEGKTVSQVIESCLSSVTAEQRESFSERWRGAFRPARRTGERYGRLAKKYF